MFLAVWILFLVAGLLLGGAWAAYQAESNFWTVVAGLLATISAAAAVAWLISEMGQ